MIVWHPSLNYESIAQGVLNMPQDAFVRIDSPFDHKWAVRDKNALPPVVDDAITFLNTVALDYLTYKVHAPSSLRAEATKHYVGVFKYNQGGSLALHVDAGIHPFLRVRKHWTALMYLGQGAGDLQFWNGSHCSGPNPMINHVICSVSPGPVVVLFENNDRAWHCSAVNTSAEDRLVLTVSYMSDELAAFDNKRTRAFFVPTPGGELWSEETFRLRDERALKGHVEAMA